MKTTISSVISSFILIGCFGLNLQLKAASGESTPGQPLKLYCGQELYPVAAEWTRAFTLSNPGSDFKIQALPVTESDKISGEGLFLLTASMLDDMEPAWKMAVGREVVVPVINPGNPWINHFREHGVSAAMLAQALNSPGQPTWRLLAGGDVMLRMNIYMGNEPVVRTLLEDFTGEESIMPGMALLSTKEVAARVAADPGAIGFCRMADIIDPATGNFMSDIALLPIDKNANGRLDYMEQIYDNATAFARGAWIGKYPRALSNEIYLAAAVNPAPGMEVEFVRWALTGGQQSLAASGLSGLVYTEVQSKIDRLDEITVVNASPEKIVSLPGTILFIIGSIVLLGLVVLGVAGIGRKKEMVNPEIAGEGSTGFDENTLSVPGGLYYDNTHTWAFMETDGSVKVGIDDFLQHVTGPVTRVILKKAGEKIHKGELLMSIIQDGKQLDVYSPLTGTIREQNAALGHHAGNINTAPYSDGWVYRIAPSNWPKEIAVLKMADKYSRWLKEEVARVKDFMAATMQSRNLAPAPVILQDGGLLKNGLLEEFGPEVWEDFQTKIMDTNR